MCGLVCCPFCGSGSVVFDLLFGVLPIGCEGSVLCLCFAVLSSFAIILKRKRELVALPLLSYDLVTVFCICSVTLPHGAEGWSVVCECGFS